jgi:2-polyprenyl-6-methoxyphenol hydroxylase-like FAD-dependent oxidoreductase
MEASRYHVIVVGGRPAGASIAARLAAAGLSVLVVDKSEFPSAPEVPSCPIMYPVAVELFEEIGFTEPKYAHAATRIHQGIVAFEGYFTATLRMPETFGRSYFYGFDRALFDTALWDHLGTFPNVTRRAGFTVTGVERDASGRVVGVTGGRRGGPPERFTAQLGVIGADGRHSFVARKVGARFTDDRDQHTSTIHFAEWQGVAPVTEDGSPALHIVSTGRGENALFFPSAPGRTSVAVQVRSDRADIAGDADAYYHRHLRALPTVRARLGDATQLGPLRGVRRIANRYREVGGPGWALVGDAAHHKDPLDGQGIRDALVGAKALAQLILAVRDGALTWSQLVVRYREAIQRATHPMFEQTMKRLERDLYRDPSPRRIRTLVRWALTDPAYQRRFLLFVGRAIEPDELRTPKLLAGVIARGIARDLRGALWR